MREPPSPSHLRPYFPRGKNPLAPLSLPYLLPWHLVACMAVSRAPGKLLLAGHGDRCLGPLLRPSSRHGRGRMNPRHLLVPSVGKTVAPSPCTTRSTRPPRRRQWRLAASRTVPAGHPLFSLPRIYSWPLISNPTAEIIRYPFVWLICIRDLGLF